MIILMLPNFNIVLYIFYLMYLDQADGIELLQSDE